VSHQHDPTLQVNCEQYAIFLAMLQLGSTLLTAVQKGATMVEGVAEVRSREANARPKADESLRVMTKGHFEGASTERSSRDAPSRNRGGAGSLLCLPQPSERGLERAAEVRVVHHNTFRRMPLRHSWLGHGGQNFELSATQ
jgi:hypothetical protein